MTTKKYDMILRNMTFSYGPYAEPVLRDLNLTVPVGDHLAIVGPSGIGKSTLAGLLCGLLRPNSGSVQFGDEIAADLPSDRLAEIRTLIPQEAYVFAGTVWDNLVYLCPTATTRQVDNGVAAIGAHELIAKVGGYSAELSPAELSAGERQLISMVRAYISPAPVVVLDEATCHLDPAAERRAEETFADRDGTLIVIAHRVSSALRARRVLVLDGISAVVGDHLTLLSTSELYRELLGHWNDEPARTNGKYDANRRYDSHDRRDEPMVSRPKLVIPQGAKMARTKPGAEGGARTTPTPTATPALTAPAPEPVGADRESQLLIFGRVTQGKNTPLVGATLTLMDPAGRQVDRDCADSGGHYRLKPPAAGNYLVICASTAHQPTAALVTVGDSPVCHDVILSDAGASLSGTVRLAGPRRPLTNAVVTLIDAQGDVAGAVGTDAKGEFSFVELAQGHYTLTVVAESLQPVARGVEIPADGHVTVDVEVAARVQLAGVVRTGTGGVVPEALATLIAPDGRVVGSMITDTEGRFVFDDLPIGVYTLIASGYPPVAAELVLDGERRTETAITLWPPTPDSSGTDSTGTDSTAVEFPAAKASAEAPGQGRSPQVAMTGNGAVSNGA